MTTFGLLGEDYPLSSSDDDSDNETTENNEKGLMIESIKKVEENIPTNKKTSDLEIKSRWNHVVQEYDDSSYIRNFISHSSTSLQNISRDTGNEYEDKEIHDISTEEVSSTVLSREQCAQGLTAALNQQKQLTQQFDKEVESDEVNRLAEIYQIQQEIQVERQNWENLYSDEESETLELSTNKKTKRKKKNKSLDICQAKDGSQYTKGERWKRLKLMAETKVKNNPEKYNSIPKNKFPLKP